MPIVTEVVYVCYVLPGTTLLLIIIRDELEMCGFYFFLKQYCTIAPTVIASVYAIAT